MIDIIQIWNPFHCFWIANKYQLYKYLNSKYFMIIYWSELMLKKGHKKATSYTSEYVIVFLFPSLQVKQ